MNIIVCLDDIGGMMFNNRRLSRDQLLIENLVEMVGFNRLFMSEYSALLFKECGDIQIIVDENYLELAKEDDFCFVEREALISYAHQIQKIILYKWNRRYPATSFFDVQLENWDVCENIDFVGNSHEKITKETYTNEKN